eukprot:SAG11_NODE_13960_length_631_cov_1.172932_1_plen_45_part_10
MQLDGSEDVEEGMAVGWKSCSASGRRGRRRGRCQEVEVDEEAGKK